MTYGPVNPKQLIAQRLHTFPELTALVPPTKMFGGAATQPTSPPYIVYWQVSGDRDRTLDGPSGLTRPRLQVDIFTTAPPSGYGQADAIAIAVRHALNGYEGLGIEGEREGADPDSNLWHIVHDYMGLLLED